MNGIYFELIQVVLGKKDRLSRSPSEKEWGELFEVCQKQAIASFVFPALEILSKYEQKPPVEILYEWIGLSEQVKGQNDLMNKEAARLTKMFENEGHRTAILKGQANARLYPNPQSRQPGDIDIWVGGGKKGVLQTLKKLHLIDEGLSKYSSEKAKENYHHFHLPKNEIGIDVEVHFRPSSGVFNPLTNYRLQKFLNQEIKGENKLVEGGFRVPSVKFALVMQLAHIHRHFLDEGVGLRQLIDFYYLLSSDIGNEREDVKGRLKELGLNHIAGAVMWVLHNVMGLEEDYFIAPIDEKRGKLLLDVVQEGGNFGQYNPIVSNKSSLRTLINRRLKRWKLVRFDTQEVIFSEILFISRFFFGIPERIRRRSWSLRGNGLEIN